jgi:hypothetical protein
MLSNHKVSEMDQETSEHGTKDSREFTCRMKEHMCCHGSGGALYGVGFLGALVYYLTTATSLWAGFLGFLKALVWPAFLVYGLLKFLGM